jgi:hypothetical protein
MDSVQDLRPLRDSSSSSTSEESSTSLLQSRESKYPIRPLYCGGTFLLNIQFLAVIDIFPSFISQVCGLPAEYCEFNPPNQFKNCIPWLLEHSPKIYPHLELQGLFSFSFRTPCNIVPITQ